MFGSTGNSGVEDPGRRAAAVLVGASFLIVAIAVISALVLLARY